jgi:uncharacterized protein with beta-barrel porin domain
MLGSIASRQVEPEKPAASFAGVSRLIPDRFTLLSLVLISLFGAAAPAWADCQPASPSSGQTVNCTGNAPTGFQVVNPTVNNLNVIVAPGATIGDNGSFAILLNSGNTVVNNGAVTGGNGVTGIFTKDGNTITNNSAVSVGNGGFGISGQSNNFITNAAGASITFGNGGFGILGQNDGNTVTNAGKISFNQGIAIVLGGNSDHVTSSGTIAGGNFALGIAGNDNNGVTHSGTMTLGDNSTGINLRDNNVVMNSGAMTLGASGAGIDARSNNTVINSGMLTIGNTGVAIRALDSNTILNSGALKAGANGAGIVAFGAGNTVTNGGSVDVGAGGFAVFTFGSQNVITNNGVVTLATATCCSSTIGLVAGSDGTVTNNKSISGGDNTVGISAFDSGNSIVNNGTVAVGAATGGPGASAGVDVSFSSGNTVINNGSIATGAGGIGIATGAGNFITNNGTVVVGANGVSIGNCGCFTSDGNMVVNNGTLDGAVNLTGSANTFTNNGLLTITDPGTAVGAMHAIDGSFAQTASGILALRVVSAGVSDALSVSGTAGLGGRLAAIVQPGLYGNTTTYLGVVTAGDPIVTKFAQVTSPSAFLAAAAAYHPNSVDLILTRIGFGSVPGENQNERAVGNALERVYSTSLTGNAASFFSRLLLAPSVTVLDQFSGEVATGSQQTTFNAMNLFLGLLTDPFIAGRGAMPGTASGAPAFAPESGEASAYAGSGRKRTAAERDAYAMFTKAPLAQAYDPRWSVWTAGFGGSQTTDGNAAVGSNNAASRVFGIAAGADYRFSPSTLAGFALAGGGTNFSVANAGTGRSDLFQAGAFLRHAAGPAYLSAALAYGWQDITTDRIVSFSGFDRLHAEFNANAWSGRVEGGYRFVTPWMGGVGITPYAAGQFTTFDLPAYAERALSGSSAFALAYGSKSVTDPRSELGVRADKSWAMTASIFTLRGRFAWAHDFNADRNIAATFQTLPGATFVVNGAAPARDAALTTVSAEMKWLNGWSAAATFEGEFSGVTRSYAGKGVVRYAW